MNLSGLFTVDLPLGRTLFLAWLIASLLHIQWGITVFIRDVSPIDFVLEAGLLFGYLILFMLVAQVLASLILLIVAFGIVAIVAKTEKISVDPITRVRNDKFWWPFIERLGRIFARLAEVAAMFAAFLWYSESFLKTIAPIGLGLALILFVLGRFD